MKKLTSVLLVLIMVLAMGASAFAATNTIENGNFIGDVATDQGDVQVQVIAGISGEVYNVTVAWESLQFTYKTAADGSWNPENHTYSYGNVAGWMINGNQLAAEVGADGIFPAVSSAITVTNHSNAEVTVDANLAGVAPVKSKTINGVNLELTSVGEQTLDNAELYYADYNSADKIVYTLKVSGTPNTGVYGESYTTIDTVTVTINK